MFQTTSEAGKTYDYGEKYSNPSRSGDARKKVDGTKKGHVIAEMWDSHHEIARRLLLGQKGVDIAKAMNVTAATVSSVKNSPVVMEKLTLMRAARDCGALDLAIEIQKMAPIALAKVKEAIETGTVLGKELSGAEILRQSNMIVDRQIGKPTQRIDTRNTHAIFGPDEIMAIKAKAKQLAGLATIDASDSEVIDV